MSGSRNGTSLGGVHLYRVVALLVTFAAAWGSLAGSPSAGICRTPARASAPATTSLPGEIAAGSTARPDVSSSEAPRVGAGTLLTAATGEDPERPVAAVSHPGGAPC